MCSFHSFNLLDIVYYVFVVLMVQVKLNIINADISNFFIIYLILINYFK